MTLKTCNLMLLALVAVGFVVSTAALMHRFGGPRRTQRIAQLLFPASQFAVVALLFACCIAYELPLYESVAFACLGLGCLPVDARLFQALDRSFDAEAEEMRSQMLGRQLAVQQACQHYAEVEAVEATRVRCSMIEQLRAADAQLDERSAAGVARDLERAVEIAGTRAARLCANHAVDALLQVKSHAARDAAIEFTVSVDLPIDLALPEVEVCAVLANLIDNAMNATRALDEGSRLVKVSARVRANFLVVTVGNSCAAAGGGKGAAGSAPAAGKPAAGVAPRAGADSRPSLAVEHGWGQGIVRSIAERHGGTFDASVNDAGLYVATVVMEIDGGGAR